MKKIYLDNAATTPLHPEVLEKMLPYLTGHFGNPSSIHSFGRKAKVAIEEARETIAEFLNCDPSEIYFTSGGTEANNFILTGIMETNFDDSGKSVLITSGAEHESVLKTAEKIGKKFNVKFVYPGKEGNFSGAAGEILSTGNLSLVSMMMTNNETGIKTPLNNFIDAAKSKGALFHTDAVQSFGKEKIDLQKLGVDALSASAHKIGGPKGTGLAFIRTGTPVSPLILGGAQERNRRGGTENVAGIVGFAEAVKIVSVRMEENQKKVASLRNLMRQGIKSIDNKYIHFNEGEKQSPFVLSITFSPEKYITDTESILMFLDINGIAASAGSACTSGTVKASHVITAMGYDKNYASGTVRFSFAPSNTVEEINHSLEIIERLADKIKKG